MIYLVISCFFERHLPVLSTTLSNFTRSHWYLLDIWIHPYLMREQFLQQPLCFGPIGWPGSSEWTAHGCRRFWWHNVLEDHWSFWSWCQYMEVTFKLCCKSPHCWLENHGLEIKHDHQNQDGQYIELPLAVLWKGLKVTHIRWLILTSLL